MWGPFGPCFRDMLQNLQRPPAGWESGLRFRALSSKRFLVASSSLWKNWCCNLFKGHSGVIVPQQQKARAPSLSSRSSEQGQSWRSFWNTKVVMDPWLITLLHHDMGCWESTENAIFNWKAYTTICCSQKADYCWPTHWSVRILVILRWTVLRLCTSRELCAGRWCWWRWWHSSQCCPAGGGCSVRNMVRNRRGGQRHKRWRLTPLLHPVFFPSPEGPRETDQHLYILMYRIFIFIHNLTHILQTPGVKLDSGTTPMVLKHTVYNPATKISVPRHVKGLLEYKIWPWSFITLV